MTKLELKGLSPIAKTLMIGGLVSPLVLTDLRIIGAMFCFWILSFCLPKEHVPHGDLLRLFGAGLLGIVFNQGCFISAVDLTSPANASIMTTSMPMWAMILAAFILKEPVTAKKITGLLLGAIGAVILIIGSSNSKATGFSGGDLKSILGDLLAITAQVSYALYMVLYKNFTSKYSLVTIMKWMFTYSFLIMIPITLPQIMMMQWEQLGLNDWLKISYISLLGTFVCYLLVVFGLKQLRPTVTGMYNYVQPTVACILAILWGLDSITVTKVIAILLIFCGVYLVSVSKSRKEMLAYKQKLNSNH